MRVLAWLSASGYLSRFVKRWGCVVKVSPSGEVLETLMDPTGERVFTVSAATEHGGQLFLGNLMGDFVSVVDLADVASSRGTGDTKGRAHTGPTRRETLFKVPSLSYTERRRGQ